MSASDADFCDPGGFTVLNDGAGVDLASSISGQRFPENPERHGLPTAPSWPRKRRTPFASSSSVLILASPAAKERRHRGVIAGTQHGLPPIRRRLARDRASKADMVLAAPEIQPGHFIATHFDRWIAGSRSVATLFDFLTGQVTGHQMGACDAGGVGVRLLRDRGGSGAAPSETADSCGVFSPRTARAGTSHPKRRRLAPAGRWSAARDRRPGQTGRARKDSNLRRRIRSPML